MNKEKLKEKYFGSKDELSKMRDDITLKRWKILSKAYKIGKKIWGTKFTREKLSIDMDIPYTTTIRCLSLDRVNKRNWNLIDKGKISVFKVAQICQSKNITYQDEIVDLVIKENYSTYQIKTLKVGSLKDISKEKHRLAIENGYSGKESAYRNFNMWIDRGHLFLIMDKDKLTNNKREEVINKLKILNKKIDSYLDSSFIKSTNNLEEQNGN